MCLILNLYATLGVGINPEKSHMLVAVKSLEAARWLHKHPLNNSRGVRGGLSRDGRREAVGLAHPRK